MGLPSNGAATRYTHTHTHRPSVRAVIIIQIYSNGPGSQRVNCERARELVDSSGES